MDNDNLQPTTQIQSEQCFRKMKMSQDLVCFRSSDNLIQKEAVFTSSASLEPISVVEMKHKNT